ncbi:nitronate monooxygenase [Bacteroides sp.]|uniref:NAD(P)H-dependent flavin oxidoreductase n=1 Tax=Bacteroides sp. TaxID=29523 RepID=UPI001B5F940A|nr:nitronate monooxygenase [Bacteroides sp.]MBP6064690.1 nitronate monooxygenase [Bacteroides sp.]MBP6067164.1 nitronate monooxygenase [Bacteroides sp.]MBP6935915.1 nitronate monooxygenase [Bacteroides sp.]MBP8621921.1 nitronate monooxygenase [Bacteroides sp.]MBP9506744.1 nitronate monooxygenase [Bacteroides sp.]
MKTLQIGRLTAILPIIQGGMGIGVSLSGLSSAVANEGGIGVISATGLSLLYTKLSSDYKEAGNLGLIEEIRKAREKTKGIIGVNVMVALSNFAELVKTSIAEKVDVLFCGAGLPLDLPAYLTEDSVTELVPIVSSARAAKLICQKWESTYQYLPAAIVLEGPQAGGHLGYKVSQLEDENYSLETLLAQVVAEVLPFEIKHNRKIPVIAAGGIFTGEDIYRMMELGASGVQMGTRFVTTDECDASIVFKQQYVHATDKDVEIIKSPVGMPGRAIRSNFLEKVKAGLRQPKNCAYNCIRTCDVEKAPYCIALALYQAYKGNFDHGFAFAGSCVTKARRIMSVKETMAELVQEFNAARLSQEALG